MLSDEKIKPVAIGSYDNSLNGYRIYLPYLTMDSNMIATGVLQIGKKSCQIKTAFGQDLNQLGNDTFLYGNVQKIKDVTDYLRTQATPAETSLLSRLSSTNIANTSDNTSTSIQNFTINTESKQDSDYMKAVESGNTEAAKKMVVHAAKASMPNTKVVDEKGEPLVVYRDLTYIKTDIMSNS